MCARDTECFGNGPCWWAQGFVCALLCSGENSTFLSVLLGGKEKKQEEGEPGAPPSLLSLQRTENLNDGLFSSISLAFTTHHWPRQLVKATYSLNCGTERLEVS